MSFVSILFVFSIFHKTRQKHKRLPTVELGFWVFTNIIIFAISFDVN